MALVSFVAPPAESSRDSSSLLLSVSNSASTPKRILPAIGHTTHLWHIFGKDSLHFERALMSYPSGEPASSKDESLSLAGTEQAGKDELRGGMSPGTAMGMKLTEQGGDR